MHRDELKAQLQQKRSITGVQMRFILDSYQIASGYSTGLGALLEMDDFLQAGYTFIVEDWMGGNVHIRSVQELKEFTKRYDVFIDW